MFSLTCNVDSFVSNGVYTRHQTRTQCHVPAHVFSRAVFHSLFCQRLSHAQHVHVAQGPHGSSVVSSQKHSSSHSVQHCTQYTFSDDPTIIEHFSGTSADFILWRDLPPRRSNKCVFRFRGRSALAHRLGEQRSCRRRQSCAGWTVSLPQILQKATILCRLNS